MKKSIIAIFLIFISFQFLMSEQIDNIVLLDTSESMFPYFSGSVDYIIHDIVQEQLENGDTFHLLSFNNFPEYEISKTLRSEKEYQDIFKRILLLQPIGKYTDLIAAFSFVYEYTANLQLNSIKKIIILTDGIHDPPPGSSFPVSSENAMDIIKISENMKRQGWDVTLVQFPRTNLSTNNPADSITESESESTNNNKSDSTINTKSESNLFPLIAETLDEPVITISDKNTEISQSHVITGAPEILYPGNLGTVGKTFKAVFIFKNHGKDPVLLKLDSIHSNDFILFDKGTDIKLESKESKEIQLTISLPENFEKGINGSPIELIFNDNYRAYPRKGNLYFNYDPAIPDNKYIINTRILLYIIIAIVLLFALVFILVNIFKSFSFSASHTSKSDKNVRSQKSFATHNNLKDFKDIENKLSVDQIVIEMIVKNQNRQIGHRNIHILKELHPRSVGGAGSEYFLIFIIETGKRIAEIVMENGVLNFIPKEEKFFPELKGKILKNCVGKTIKVINKNGIETSVIFKKWVSPVDQLNRIMHLVDKSGSPDFRY